MGCNSVFSAEGHCNKPEQTGQICVQPNNCNFGQIVDTSITPPGCKTCAMLDHTGNACAPVACIDFIWVDGVKVCGEGLACPGAFKQWSYTVKSLICYDCYTTTDFKLNEYCVNSCEGYAQKMPGCNKMLTTEGSCNKPKAVGQVCEILPPGECLPGLFKNALDVCVPCQGTNEFVDYTGKLCIATCSDFLYMHASDWFGKACADGLVCNNNLFIFPNQLTK